ncbi:DUF2911 domain-containing protein [Flammeovirga kamogawensis]|uniref:DUF2911 domain-containing protein n=1 Tax=Flammeovirga kamogawensis TaxID=373891 RepID=A0ABX8GRC0_9BACT|nr:DUF2911 domain-containing protein [Flammeovirga kamogawensis]MBB6462784.1 hypothetical protein [Flammeovirga kamogawensis]QWG05988.1 DUF2911 domain-containing protein [Flammeovirga kamogawensis]TRX67816.1 DUF2911 domain-containing protein [Flammeovirga kamogawensis]
MKKHILLLVLFLCIGKLFAQELKHKPRKSDTGLATYKMDNGTYVKITYGRPKMKSDFDKKFGVSVPWRKLWRFGDDDATEITITEDVTLAGEPLEAGTYSLYAIPDTAEWTLVVNKAQGAWGTFKYNQKEDVFRVKLPALNSFRIFQQFSIFLQEDPDGCNLVAIWERISIVAPIRKNEEND